MKEEIRRAYDAVQPDEAVYDRILAGVKQAKPRKSGAVLRRVVGAAACIAILAGLSAVAVAAYHRWMLPEPETYTPDPENGAFYIHETVEYTSIPETVPDGAFLAKAAQVLEQVGLTDVDQSRMTVTRQEHLFWAREEVEVLYAQDEQHTSLRFDAETGYLLHLDSIDWIDNAQGASCENIEQAIALAEDYYAKLPVPQGYEYTDCTEYDEQYWSLEFCRNLGDGLYNAYEMVRIGLNPVSGRLTGVNVFYVPLLDDHEPGDEPLTQAQAEEIVRSSGKLNLTDRELTKAEIAVVLPNWFFTDSAGDLANARASDVTRLAWRLVYENPGSEFADIVEIHVDLYTGEILGGEMTK